MENLNENYIFTKEKDDTIQVKKDECFDNSSGCDILATSLSP